MQAGAAHANVRLAGCQPDGHARLSVAPQIHHGNGTQKAFYEDDRVLFVSLHRRDKDFYPEVRRLRRLSFSEKNNGN